MQVTQIAKGDISCQDIPEPTNEEMQNEYDYLLSEQLTRNLLQVGLITPAEYDKIMLKNQRAFSPYIWKILGKST